MGILLTGAGTLSLSTLTVELTQPSNPEEINDGYGVLIDETATFNSQDNLYSGNVLLGVQVLSGSANMTNDEVSGSLSTEFG